MVSIRLTWLIGSLFFSRTTLKWLTYQYKYMYMYITFMHTTTVYEICTLHMYTCTFVQQWITYVYTYTHISMQGLNFAIAIASENSKYFSLDTCYTHIYLMLEDIFPQSPGHIFCKYDQSTSQFWSIMMPSSWHSCQWLEMETSLVLAFL